MYINKLEINIHRNISMVWQNYWIIRIKTQQILQKSGRKFCTSGPFFPLRQTHHSNIVWMGNCNFFFYRFWTIDSNLVIILGRKSFTMALTEHSIYSLASGFTSESDSGTSAAYRGQAVKVLVNWPKSAKQRPEMFKQIKDIYCKRHLNPALEDGGGVGRQGVQKVLIQANWELGEAGEWTRELTWAEADKESE